ncbi:MAG TPA: VanZ family protein [Phycisphaerae bacterium]|nr:VanZ family protein [Phycisphaerae bacterium]HNU44332.1 VanZ family protein [Phycisphaerae bacterium]
MTRRPELLEASPRSVDHGVSPWWSAAYALALAYGSLLPFRFDTARLGVGLLLPGSGLRWAPTTLEDVLTNVAAYVPLGLLVALGLTHRRHWALTGVLAVTIAALTSVAVETVQGAIPLRVSSWTDVVLNLAGSLLGVVLAPFARGVLDIAANAIRPLQRWAVSASHTCPSGRLWRHEALGVVLAGWLVAFAIGLLTPAFTSTHAVGPAAGTHAAFRAVLPFESLWRGSMVAAGFNVVTTLGRYALLALTLSVLLGRLRFTFAWSTTAAIVGMVAFAAAYGPGGAGMRAGLDPTGTVLALLSVALVAQVFALATTPATLRRTGAPLPPYPASRIAASVPR